MEIVENSKDRLMLVGRPWWQSITYLAMAIFVTFLSFVASDTGEPIAMQWVVTASAIVLWWGFFLHAQRSEITFDRRAGQLRIARHRMFDRTGVIVPLSAIADIRAERVAPLKRWPWQYGITLSTRASDFEGTLFLVPGFLAETEAVGAAGEMSAWLDSASAAA